MKVLESICLQQSLIKVYVITDEQSDQITGPHSGWYVGQQLTPLINVQRTDRGLDQVASTPKDIGDLLHPLCQPICRDVRVRSKDGFQVEARLFTAADNGVAPAGAAQRFGPLSVP